MPAVAVVGGIATAAGAASGAAALIGGTITLSTVASGLAFVGGVASSLGGITGNKKLVKFGMIAGLAGSAVGGIGSLMNGSGSAGSATTLATGDSGLGLSAGAAGEGLKASGMGLDGIGTSLNMGASQAGSGAGMLGAGIGDSLANLNTGASSMVAETANAATNAAAAPVSYALNDPAAINVGGGNFAPNTSSAMADASGQLRVPATTMPGGSGESMFGKFGSAIKNNPELVKTATGILGGLGQSYMQDKQMRERERLSAERRARMNASILDQQSRF